MGEAPPTGHLLTSAPVPDSARLRSKRLMCELFRDIPDPPIADSQLEKSTGLFYLLAGMSTVGTCCAIGWHTVAGVRERSCSTCGSQDAERGDGKTLRPHLLQGHVPSGLTPPRTDPASQRFPPSHSWRVRTRLLTHSCCVLQCEYAIVHVICRLQGFFFFFFCC